MKQERVIDKVRNELKKRSINGVVKLHTKDIHHLFEWGLGSCSIDRYIRMLRQRGEITYKDPRSNNYMYEIELTEKFFEFITNGEEIWKN